MENLMPKVRFVFDRRKEADNYKDKGASRTADVLVELYYRQQRKWFKTGVKVYAGQWDAQKWVVNRVDSAQLNSRLSVIMSRVNSAITSSMSKDSFSVSVVEAVFRAQECDNLFDTEVEKHVSILTAKGLSRTTINIYTSMMGAVRAFGRIKRIEDLTADNIDAFNDYLRNKAKLRPNTTYHYMIAVRSVCTRLVLEGKLGSNPFNDVCIKRPGADKEEIRYLTEDELEKLENLPLTREIDIFARDLFLFQANTGMAFSDAGRVVLDDLVEEGGRWILRDRRKKTSVRFAIIILPKAMELLRKHGQFNRYSNYHVNNSLHYIGMLCFGKEITTHMARHSFAVRALRHGIPIEYVSKMLGHTNINTTQRYAKVLAEDVLKQFEKLM